MSSSGSDTDRKSARNTGGPAGDFSQAPRKGMFTLATDALRILSEKVFPFESNLLRLAKSKRIKGKSKGERLLMTLGCSLDVKSRMVPLLRPGKR